MSEPVDAWRTHPAFLANRARLQAFAYSLDLEFHDPVLLFVAFVHSSFANEQAMSGRCMDNGRLEFLGDAVLSLLVAELLFHRFPHHKEGQLTQMRADLVRAETLGQWAADVALGDYLLLGRSGEQGNLRQNGKILSDTFEALVGAITLDQGYTATASFLQRWLEPALDHWAQLGTLRNAKSELQELIQGTRHLTPHYERIAASGPDHARTYVVHVMLEDRILGVGEGTSYKRAEFRAAEDALAQLDREASVPADQAQDLSRASQETSVAQGPHTGQQRTLWPNWIVKRLSPQTKRGA